MSDFLLEQHKSGGLVVTDIGVAFKAKSPLTVLPLREAHIPANKMKVLNAEFIILNNAASGNQLMTLIFLGQKPENFIEIKKMGNLTVSALKEEILFNGLARKRHRTSKY